MGGYMTFRNKFSPKYSATLMAAKFMVNAAERQFVYYHVVLNYQYRS